MRARSPPRRRGKSFGMLRSCSSTDRSPLSSHSCSWYRRNGTACPVSIDCHGGASTSRIFLSSPAGASHWMIQRTGEAFGPGGRRPAGKSSRSMQTARTDRCASRACPCARSAARGLSCPPAGFSFHSSDRASKTSGRAEPRRSVEVRPGWRKACCCDPARPHSVSQGGDCSFSFFTRAGVRSLLIS